MTKCCAFKVYPNATQMKIISNTLGCCRFVFNKFLEVNFKNYDDYKSGKLDKKSYITAYTFSKEWLTPAKKSDEYSFLDDVSSKALKDSLNIADKAFKHFFKHPKKFHRPRFKGKKDPVSSYYFIKDGVRFEHHRIWIPILRWVRTTQDNYIPECGEITGGRIVKDGDDYYAILTYKVPKGYRKAEAKKFGKQFRNEMFPGCEYAESGTSIGIDLGIKTYATIVAYNRMTNNATCVKVPTFLKDPRVVALEDKIKTYQRIISRKTEINKSKKLEKGVCYNSYSIRKLRKKISKCYKKLRNIKIDFIRKLCYGLAITKPDYIAIEDLATEKMLRKGSHKLAGKIQKSLFREFRDCLISKCKEFDVELRIIDKHYASSKTCCRCGNKKSKLKLSERTYVCENCGKKIDRDVNAAVNILKCNKFKIVD